MPQFQYIIQQIPECLLWRLVLIWRHVVQCSMCVTWLLKQQSYGIKRKKGEGKGINQWVCQFEGFKLFTMRFWDVSASLSSLRSWRIYQASVQMNSLIEWRSCEKNRTGGFSFFFCRALSWWYVFLRCKICQRNRCRYWLITWSFSL